MNITFISQTNLITFNINKDYKVVGLDLNDFVEISLSILIYSSLFYDN